MQRPKERRLWFGEIEPGRPAFTLKDNHLTVVYRRHVGSRLRCEEREGVAGPVVYWPPEAGEAKPLLANFGELPFRFWGPFASKLKEMGRRDQATANREAPSLGPEIDNGRPFALRWRWEPHKSL